MDLNTMPTMNRKRTGRIVSGIAVGAGLGWFIVQLLLSTSIPPSPDRGEESVVSLDLQRSRTLPSGLTAAVRTIHSVDAPSQQSKLGLAFASSVPLSEIEQTLDHLHHLPAHAVRSVVERILLHRWGRHDPDRAVTWTLINRSRLASPMVAQWFREDREAAEDFVRGQPPMMRELLYGHMALALADEDLTGTIAFLKQYPEGNYVSVLEKLARQDPQALISHLNDLPTGLAGRHIFASIWGETDPEAAFAWARWTDDFEVTKRVFERLRDPDKAVELSIKDSAERLGALLKTVAHLPEETAAALQQKVFEVRQESRNKPPSPPKTMDELASDLANGAYVKSIDTMEPKEETSLMEAIDALPVETRTKARGWYFDRARNSHRYTTAAKLVVQLPVDDPVTLGRVSELSAHWAHHDPKAATSWVESLSSGPVRTWAIRNAAQQWSRLNPEAAEAWLATLPEKIELEPQQRGVPPAPPPPF